MVGPTPSAAPISSSVAGRDRRDRREVLRERPRGGRADVPDGQRDDHPPQRRLLGLLQVAQQRRARSR